MEASEKGRDIPVVDFFNSALNVIGDDEADVVVRFISARVVHTHALRNDVVNAAVSLTLKLLCEELLDLHHRVLGEVSAGVEKGRTEAVRVCVEVAYVVRDFEFNTLIFARVPNMRVGGREPVFCKVTGVEFFAVEVEAVPGLVPIIKKYVVQVRIPSTVKEG